MKYYLSHKTNLALFILCVGEGVCGYNNIYLLHLVDDLQGRKHKKICR